MPVLVKMTIPLPALGAAVEGLCGINAVILRVLERDGRPLPRLYDSPIRYRQPGKLTWHTVADLYDLGWGDCKDLVAVRCAELRVYDGEPAMPLVYETRRRGRWHAVLRRADGSIEDPSRVLVTREKASKR